MTWGRMWCGARGIAVGYSVAGLGSLTGADRCQGGREGWEIIAVEVMPDHVLLFVKHEPKASASDVANQFKGFTSGVPREEFPHLK